MICDICECDREEEEMDGNGICRYCIEEYETTECPERLE